MFIITENASRVIKEIVSGLTAISSGDFYILEKHICGARQFLPPAKKRVHVIIARLHQIIVQNRTKLTNNLLNKNLFPQELPNISKPQIQSFLKDIIPLWEKFLHGDVFPLLHELMGLPRAPQVTSIEAELFLIINEAKKNDTKQKELDYVKSYFENYLEDGACVEMLSDCVI